MKLSQPLAVCSFVTAFGRPLSKHLWPARIIFVCLIILPGPVCGAEMNGHVIQFPQDHSLGEISVGDLRPTDAMWALGWSKVGEARGLVSIPANTPVRLTLSARDFDHLPVLAILGSDDIQAIGFKGSRHIVGNDALEKITTLTKLILLDLRGTVVTNTGLRSLPKLSSLEALNLASTEIGDTGLEVVGRLHSLRSLNLSATSVTDDGLMQLRHLNSLEVLWLSHTNVSGKGFHHLSKLGALKEIYLPMRGVTDDGVREIAKLRNLEVLAI